MSTYAGDLLQVKHGIIVHGCNAKGVMGSGVARAIRATYPGAFEVYHDQYQKAGLPLGTVVWYKVSDEPALAVANAITQASFGGDPTVRYVDYEAVRASMARVGDVARRHNLPVHYPRIGAGLGNGDWSIIKAHIDEALAGVEHHLWVPPHEWDVARDGPYTLPPAPAARVQP